MTRYEYHQLFVIVVLSEPAEREALREGWAIKGQGMPRSTLAGITIRWGGHGTPLHYHALQHDNYSFHIIEHMCYNACARERRRMYFKVLNVMFVIGSGTQTGKQRVVSGKRLADYLALRIGYSGTGVVSPKRAFSRKTKAGVLVPAPL